MYSLHTGINVISSFICSWTQRYTQTLPSSRASRSLCWTDCTSCTQTTVRVRSCCVRTTAPTRPSLTSPPTSSMTVNWFPVGTSQHIRAITHWRFSRHEARTCSMRTAQDSIILLRYVRKRKWNILESKISLFVIWNTVVSLGFVGINNCLHKIFFLNDVSDSELEFLRTEPIKLLLIIL